MIYMACHSAHGRRESSADNLSSRDAAILSHLGDPDLNRLKPLAGHLRLAPSTVSEALHRLIAQGYATDVRDEDDERRVRYELTERGRAAMNANSVLEPERVRRLLESLSDADREKAIAGLELIAQAAKRLSRED